MKTNMMQFSTRKIKFSKSLKFAFLLLLLSAFALGSEAAIKLVETEPLHGAPIARSLEKSLEKSLEHSLLIKPSAGLLAPEILSFSPRRGVPGSKITILGTNLKELTSFKIGGKDAFVLSNDGSKIVAMTDTHARTGPIALSTKMGSAVGKANFTVPVGTSYVIGNEIHPASEVAPNNGDGTGAFNMLSISSDGNYAAFGNTKDGGNLGAVFVYTKVNGVWVIQQKIVPGDAAPGNVSAGATCALSGDGLTLIFGGFSDAANAGAVWVYTRSGSVWSPAPGGKLHSPGGSGTTQFGNGSISLSHTGSLAVMSANLTSGSGSVSYVFARSGGTYVYQSTLPSSSTPQMAQISGDGSTIAIGAGPIASGYANVYTLVGGTWTQQGATFTATVGGNTFFGQSGVSLSDDGNTLAVSAYYESSSSGAIYIYITALREAGR